MKIKKTYYPDGSFYSTIEEFTPKLTFRINSYSDLWQLRQIKDICDHAQYVVNLTTPCLFDAQADKRFNDNESANLKMVCKFINDMKWESVKIFHPHNQEAVEMAIDNLTIVDNTFLIKEVLSEIYCEGHSIIRDKGIFYHLKPDLPDNLILMSTDAGGFKPLMKLCDKIKWGGETFSASKSRKQEDGKSKLIQQVDRANFEGKDILIIDDLCVNGGTFIGLAKMLKERNCGKLYLAISHLTVDKPNPELWSAFDKVFTTDSKGLSYFKPVKDYATTPKNLDVLKIFGS
jgi:ribose-phosphate pyrophosphokinase